MLHPRRWSMKKRTVVLLALILSLAETSAQALTLNEVITRHINARGGAARLKAIRSLRLTGTVTFGRRDRKIEAGWGTAYKRPGLIRTEVTLQGVTAINAFDGKQGWSV